MAVDIKLEKFALDTFYYVEKEIGIPKVLQISWMEYELKKIDAFIETVSYLIIFRLDIFRVKFKELEKDVEFLRRNEVNFVHYIRENMSKYFPYHCMHIYDKIFMSVAVVIELSKLLYQKENRNYSAPHIWSMYFEKEFKEEFYAKKDCWEKLEEYVSGRDTHLIRDWKFNHPEYMKFQTDIQLAESVHNRTRESYNYSSLIDTFKQRINGPLCFFFCSECLPLFDALYFLTFGDKLVNDFQLVEGYLQIFVRLWYVTCKRGVDYIFSDTWDTLSKLLHCRIFVKKEYNPEGEHGGKNCMFCDDIKENDVFLKYIIHRTVSDEAIAKRAEKWRKLRLFLEPDCNYSKLISKGIEMLGQ